MTMRIVTYWMKKKKDKEVGDVADISSRGNVVDNDTIL